MDAKTIIAQIQVLEPAIASVVAALDPAVAASVGVAESVLSAAEGLYAQLEALRAAKGAVDPATWNAQVDAFNAAVQAVSDAEAGR